MKQANYPVISVTKKAFYLPQMMMSVTWLSGRFPLSHNVYVCTHIKFTHLNKIEAMYGRLCINVKVEPCSTFRYLHKAFLTSPLFYLCT